MTTTQRVAYLVEINDMACIVFATTPAKARWIAVKGYRDAGYGRRGEWPRPTAKRIPLHDGCLLRHKNEQPWTEEYVANYPRDSFRTPLGPRP